MLLVLAKEIYEYTYFIVSESIYVEKGVGGGGALPPRSQRILEISNEMESFPLYGSIIIFWSLF